MILSDEDIRAAVNSGWLHVEPWDDSMVQPASLDVRLGETLREFKTLGGRPIDPYDQESNLTRERPSDQFLLRSGEFVLGTTVERFELPADLVGVLNGRSSLGRLGLQVHSTAGFVDPGFRGPITLEISNIGVRPVRLHAQMGIAQMVFFRMTSAAARPYGSPGLGSKYQDQDGPTESRYRRKE